MLTFKEYLIESDNSSNNVGLGVMRLPPKTEEGKRNYESKRQENILRKQKLNLPITDEDKIDYDQFYSNAQKDIEREVMGMEHWQKKSTPQEIPYADKSIADSAKDLFRNTYNYTKNKLKSMIDTETGDSGTLDFFVNSDSTHFVPPWDQGVAYPSWAYKNDNEKREKVSKWMAWPSIRPEVESDEENDKLSLNPEVQKNIWDAINLGGKSIVGSFRFNEMGRSIRPTTDKGTKHREYDIFTNNPEEGIRAEFIEDPSNPYSKWNQADPLFQTISYRQALVNRLGSEELANNYVSAVRQRREQHKGEIPPSVVLPDISNDKINEPNPVIIRSKNPLDYADATFDSKTDLYKTPEVPTHVKPYKPSIVDMLDGAAEYFLKPYTMGSVKTKYDLAPVYSDDYLNDPAKDLTRPVLDKNKSLITKETKTPIAIDDWSMEHGYNPSVEDSSAVKQELQNWTPPRFGGDKPHDVLWHELQHRLQSVVGKPASAIDANITDDYPELKNVKGIDYIGNSHELPAHISELKNIYHTKTGKLLGPNMSDEQTEDFKTFLKNTNSAASNVLLKMLENERSKKPTVELIKQLTKSKQQNFNQQYA